MSNSCVKIIFYLNLVFLLTASAVDESANERNELNPIKERINSHYYEFVNELYSNRYLIGNCSHEDDALLDINSLNEDLENFELLFTETTLNNKTLMILHEKEIIRYLKFLKNDLHDMNSCRNKNKIFKENDYKIINESRKFLLHKSDEISRYYWVLNVFRCPQKDKEINDFQNRINSDRKNKNLTIHETYLNLRQIYYNTLLDFDKNFEFLIHCAARKIRNNCETFLKRSNKLLSNYEKFNIKIGIQEYLLTEKTYLSFQKYFKYIQECASLKRKFPNKRNDIFNNWMIKKNRKHFLNI